jgi:uncharacterized protein (DUF58 family)
VRKPTPTVLGVKGAGFFLILLVAFFAATYSNLFFLLLTFLTVLGILNLIWTARSLSGVICEVLDPGPLPAGSGHHLVFRARTSGRPRYAVLGETVLEEGGKLAGGADVVSGTTDLRVPFPTLSRGVHRIRGHRVSSSWPFGLLRVSRPAPGPSEIVVYPAPAEVPETTGAGNALGELCAALGFIGGNLQPAGVREHRAGDGLGRIHWKASARRGDLVVTEWEGGGGTGAEVLLDRRAEPEAFEEALSTLSALALAAQEGKEPLTLHSQGVSTTFGPTHQPTAKLLRWLAMVTPLPLDGPPPPPASPGILRLPTNPAGARR